MQPVDASDQPATVSDFPVAACNQTDIASVNPLADIVQQVSDSGKPFAASFQAVQPFDASFQAVQPDAANVLAIQPVGGSV